MQEVKVGAVYKQTMTVEASHLACHVGSGDVQVYATPMMIALMEQAASLCLRPFLEDGETSVGIALQTDHIAATPCGMQVSAEATITAVDGRKVSFTIVAKDEKETIGTAHHKRFVVKKEKFEQRAAQKGS